MENQFIDTKQNDLNETFNLDYEEQNLDNSLKFAEWKRSLIKKIWRRNENIKM